MWRTMKDNANLLQFPCPYPLKVLGKNTNAFHAVVSAIIEKHSAEGDEVTYSTRGSSGGKYMSVTATFTAQSQEQLARIYEELNGHELVVMVL
jgi:putative lipoic acid-binding regulatory protein